MTIFTNKAGDKKDDSDIPSPEVVSEYKLLVEEEKKKDEAVVVAIRTPPPPYPVARAAIAVGASYRRRPLLKLWACVLAVVLLVIMAFIFFMIYKTLAAHHQREMYMGHCGVRYHNSMDEDGSDIGEAMEQSGEFNQEITIEDLDHEKIEVPVIGDMRRSTVLHDFNQNLTVIVDRDQQYCFLLPLNRSLVVPPRDFWDLLMKLKTGYYIPDVDVIRENYRAMTPAVTDVAAFGYNIWKECHEFQTFKLVREDEPIAMAKRSACEVAGKKWCLGDAGTKKMLCINIKSCV